MKYEIILYWSEEDSAYIRSWAGRCRSQRGG